MAMDNSSQKKTPKYHSKLEFIGNHQKEFYIFKSSTLNSYFPPPAKLDQTVPVVTVVMWMPQCSSSLWPRIHSLGCLETYLRCSYTNCQRAKKGVRAGGTAHGLLA